MDKCINVEVLIWRITGLNNIRKHKQLYKQDQIKNYTKKLNPHLPTCILFISNFTGKTSSNLLIIIRPDRTSSGHVVHVMHLVTSGCHYSFNFRLSLFNSIQRSLLAWENRRLHCQSRSQKQYSKIQLQMGKAYTVGGIQ